MTRAIEVWDKFAGHVMYDWRVIEAESVEAARSKYPTARYVGGVLEWWDSWSNLWTRSTNQHWTLEETSRDAQWRQYRLVPYPDTTYAESPDVWDATFIYTKGDESRPDSVTYPKEERHELVIHPGPKDWVMTAKEMNDDVDHMMLKFVTALDCDMTFTADRDAMALFATTRHDLIDQRREGRTAWSRTIEAAWRVELSDLQREQFIEQARTFRTMLTHLVKRT